MIERPIVASSPLVSALIERRKTQTRSAVAPSLPLGADTLREFPGENRWYAASISERTGHSVTYRSLPPDQQHDWSCPFGVYGDRLWVREALQRRGDGTWEYAADRRALRAPERAAESLSEHGRRTRCVAVAMPRWACRMMLAVTEVRVQRLQALTEDDAEAEGCFASGPALTAQQQFVALWNSTNAAHLAWEANPWVWAVSFRLVSD